MKFYGFLNSRDIRERWARADMGKSDFNQGIICPKAYKIIVCGGRHFENYTLLESIIKNYLDENGIAPTDVEIVSGHCQGADSLVNGTRKNTDVP